MKKYDTPTLDVEWFTAQTALSQSTTDPDKENPGTCLLYTSPSPRD